MRELTAGMVISRDRIVVSEFNFAKPLTIALLASRAKYDNLPVEDCRGDLATFLSRVGYYDFVGISDPFRIHRRNNPKTLELADASNDFCPEIDQVYDRVRFLLRDHPSRETIELVLPELVTNVRLHSEGAGIVVGQVIRNVLILALVDNGIGVRAGLAIEPKYGALDERQAIELAVQKGVGNGRGRGLGLWIATEVAKLGQGNFLIGSGGYANSTDERGIFKIPQWRGTFIEWKFDLNTPPVRWTPGQDEVLEDNNGEDDFFG